MKDDLVYYCVHADKKGRRDGSARPPWPATQDKLKRLMEVVNRSPACFCLARDTKELRKNTGLFLGKNMCDE